MKKITLNFISTLILGVCLLFTFNSNAQVFYSESWTDSGPGLAGWTNAGTGGTFSRVAAASVCDGAGARANIWQANNVRQFISPLVGISDGGLTTLEFEYKATLWSSNGANNIGAPSTDFTIDIEWAIDLAGPWLSLGQINADNHVVSGDCAPGPDTYQFTPNVGDEVYVRFVVTRLDGDNYYNFDNVTVQEPITSPPNCDATLTATTEVSIAGDISWLAATGGANAYDLTVGTTSGGSEVLATTDVGNVTSYNVGALEFSTTYYVTIVPKNDNGSATGCVEQTFETRSAPTPPTVDIVFDINSCGDSDSYNVAYAASTQPFVWVQLNYVGGCDSVTVDTLGSTGTSSGGRLDTEIGLYDSNGILIGDNDDIESGNVLSSLTVASLPAGTYYIVAGPWNTVFGAEDFNVTTTNTTRTGTLFINASTPSNETAEFVNLQFPFEATIEQGGTATVYAQIFKSGITEPAGQGAGIQAWIGVSNTDATTTADFESATWNWVPATYNVDNGNNDEYEAEIGAGLEAGTYYYVSRFSVLGGPFSYGGINPGASDGNFWDGTNFVSGVLTVTPATPPLCASDPFPTDGATDVAVGGTILTWTPPASGPTPTSYNVYIVDNIDGDNPDLVANTTTNSLEVNINAFDTTIYWLVLPLNGPAEAESCAVWNFTTQSPPGFCLSAPFGQWPGAAYTPAVCNGETANSITTVGFAGEYSVVNVEEGQTYEFSSSVATDLITISADAGATAATFGTTPVLWTSTITGQIRFYTHLNDQCESQNTSRTRFVKCGASLSVDSFNMSDFSFGPNPVKNILTLTAQNNIEQVTVFNMLGQAVIKTAPNRNISEIDMSNLGSGTYFAQVSVNGIIKTVKVLKD